MPKLRRSIKDSNALKSLDELEYVVRAVQKREGTKIIIDMSITMGYMNYYDGIIFKGFVRDISSNVVMGGQYNKLMKCFNRSISAIGFAIYLNAISTKENKRKYDVDIFVLYRDNDDIAAVYSKVCSLISEGHSVLAGKNIDKSLKAKKIINFGEI